VLQWLRLSFVASGSCRDHFTHFGHLAGLPRSSYSFRQLIWMAYVWVIWKERNSKGFYQKITDYQTLADKVKLLSFQWLKENMQTFVFSYHDWWLHPLLCIGVRL